MIIPWIVKWFESRFNLVCFFFNHFLVTYSLFAVQQHVCFKEWISKLTKYVMLSWDNRRLSVRHEYILLTPHEICVICIHFNTIADISHSVSVFILFIFGWGYKQTHSFSSELQTIVKFLQKSDLVLFYTEVYKYFIRVHINLIYQFTNFILLS